MLGIILSSFGSLFEEVSDSIGKLKVSQKQESIYTMGFLSVFWGTVIFAVIIIFKREFIFSPASLPTFALRAVLEVILAHIVVVAVNRADRSTFGFIRIFTIPLLIMVDLLAGYKITHFQAVGMAILFLVLGAVFLSKGIKKEGRWLIFLTSVLAVITISLYKYDITYFNSVEAEQSIIMLILMVYFFLAANYRARENPLRFLLKPVFLAQSMSTGVGGVITSIAYVFAPASIILSAQRSSAALWTVASGGIVFSEKNILLKLAFLFFIIAGLILLAF